jgi:RNA polymerase sigma factor (sigma-70 family)
LQNNPDLFAAFREGRREALEQVYVAHVGSIERYVRALARSHGRRDIDQTGMVGDLIQEIFVRAFSGTARAGYDGCRQFDPYLKAIARNCFIDVLRARGREELKNPDELAALSDHNLSTDGAAADLTMLAVVASYLRTLPPNLNDVYQQRFVLERSQEAASHALDLSRRTIRTAEARLVSGLRKALALRGVRLRNDHITTSRRQRKHAFDA